ncbi:hypothetical protein SO694_00076056 [Aureococcus anophagefferens]|uniref:Glycosyl transferase family 1 domain-containing protein n=1 Tax=Aureococcus anophagefferens TaxID=44056 RepID=A0ABR1FHX7_AURAN
MSADVEVDEPAGVFAQTFLLLPGGDAGSGGGGGRVFDAGEASLGRVAEAMLAGAAPGVGEGAGGVGDPVVAAVHDGVPALFAVVGSRTREALAFCGGAGGRGLRGGGGGGDGGLCGFVAEAVAVTLRCVEFYGGVACDLLSPSPGSAASRGGGEAPPVVVDRDARAGPVVLGAAAPRVHSADGRRLLREARAPRQRAARRGGRAACGACYVELEIHHLARPPGGGAPGAAPARAPYLTDDGAGGWARHCASRVVLVEWPGLEKLAVPRDALVLGEGSHRHRTLLAFQACLGDLAAVPLPARAPSRVQLTELLAEAWGGNATLACLACVGAGDAPPVKRPRSAGAALGACRQFPWPGARRTSAASTPRGATMRAVLEAAARDARREAAKLRRARRGENAPGDSDDDEAYGHALRERLGALERALASSQETAATAREDSVKVYKVLELFKAKYTALADHKAKLAKDLIVAEQAKLEVARALVDAKLRASDVDEAKARDAFGCAFGRESEVLAAKDEAAELGVRCEELQVAEERARARGAELEGELRAARTAGERLRADGDALREARDASEGRRVLEEAKNVELSGELLSLVAQRDALRSRLDDLERLGRKSTEARVEAETASADYSSKNDELAKSLLETRFEVGELQGKYARAEAALEHARAGAERALLDRDGLRRRDAETLRQRDAELAESRRLMDEGLAALRTMRDDEGRAATKARGETRRGAPVPRPRVEAHARRRRRAAGAAAAAAGERLAALEAAYRARLDGDLADALRGRSRAALEAASPRSSATTRRRGALRGPRGVLPRQEPKAPDLYASIAFASAVAFVGELARCLLALAWYGARRLLRGRDESERRSVAVYCGFGLIPGERREWSGASLAGGIGGSEQCAIRLSRALAARGEAVVVYCACGAPRVVDGVRYEPTASFDPWAAYASLVVWRLPQFLLAQRLAGSGGLALRTQSVAYWIHDGAYLELLRRGGAPFLAIVRFAVRGADAVVFPSEAMRAAQYAALFPTGGGDDVGRMATVVPHGVPRYFDGGENKREDGWLLWPVSVERGLDALLAALPRLRAAVEGRGGDFKLVVCHHEDGYHARGGSRRELPADVVFAGMLPPRELAALYRTCALFVFPSSVPEAFSLSSWECALHGVVPVAYSLGALEALGAVGCPLARPGDLDGLVDAAAALLADSERRCASLAYKAARLEAELDAYRDYMKKTVRRYQRSLKIGPSPAKA